MSEESGEKQKGVLAQLAANFDMLHREYDQQSVDAEEALQAMSYQGQMRDSDYERMSEIEEERKEGQNRVGEKIPTYIIDAFARTAELTGWKRELWRENPTPGVVVQAVYGLPLPGTENMLRVAWTLYPPEGEKVGNREQWNISVESTGSGVPDGYTARFPSHFRVTFEVTDKDPLPQNLYPADVPDSLGKWTLPNTVKKFKQRKHLIK